MQSKPLVSSWLATSHRLGIALVSAAFILSIGSVRADYVGQSQSALGLDSLVSMAVQGHPEVLARRAAEAQAQYGVDSARWQFFPTPSFNAQRLDGANVASASIQQPLWTGGRLTADLAYAKSQLKASEIGIDEARYQLAQSVASSWTSVVASTAQIKVLESAQAELLSLEQMMLRREATGLSASSELDLLRSRMAQNRSDMAQVNADLQSALEALQQLTGQEINPAFINPLWKASLTNLDPSTLIELSLASSPQLARLSAEQEAAAVRIKQARSQVMPTLFVKYEYQDGSANAVGVRNEGVVSFGIQQSLGAGLSVMSSVGGAQAGLDAAREAYNAAQRQLKTQVVSDLQGYEALRNRLKESAVNLAGVERVSESYRRMFLAGKRGWLDLLNMVRERSDVARSLAVSQAQVSLYEFRLQMHSGEFPWK